MEDILEHNEESDDEKIRIEDNGGFQNENYVIEEEMKITVSNIGVD